MRIFCVLLLTASLFAQQSAPKEAEPAAIPTETAMQHLANYAAPIDFIVVDEREVVSKPPGGKQYEYHTNNREHFVRCPK